MSKDRICVWLIIALISFFAITGCTVHIKFENEVEMFEDKKKK